MKVTNTMISKWAKAGLLVILGIVLLLYIQPVMDEFEMIFEEMASGQADMLFNLMTAVLWIIVLWCFVDAVINIVTSFREQKLTVDDLGAKIDKIEKMLTSAPESAPAQPQQRPMIVAQDSVKIEEPEPVSPPAPPPEEPPPPP
ncbi:MAG: hypothetical protein OEV21_07745 [Thermoplasmata archaeon]|nr:hypothetical protein [Thermoplasmata archaeon]